MFIDMSVNSIYVVYQHVCINATEYVYAASFRTVYPTRCIVNLNDDTLRNETITTHRKRSKQHQSGS